MATAKPQEYGNESISQLKGADRVRKRPGVIFGSDGLEGCEHAVFEILSNSIDEAREGFGNIITVTLYDDKSIEVEDFGRGCPVDWNPAEKRFNWELVYCELYAGGKYKNDDGGDYEYSLGLNGLGACAHAVRLRVYGCYCLARREQVYAALRQRQDQGQNACGTLGPEKDRHDDPLEAGY